MLLIRSFSSIGLLGRVSRTFLPTPLGSKPRIFSTSSTPIFEDLNTYHRVADETLESLSQKLEEVIENQKEFADADISLSTGVLTLQLPPFGTYVINKQTPNRQIWLSSPISGPKRYDFLKNTWVYKHNNSQMHRLLEKELTETLKMEVHLSECEHAREE